MKLGFGSGACYRMFQSPEQRCNREYIDLLSQSGKASCIELMCHDEADLDYLLQAKDIDLSKFSYISVHAPASPYAADDKFNHILRQFRELTRKFPIRNIVFHPDTVLDWSVFEGYQDLPISIENMDERKQFGKTVEDIQSILSKHSFGLTLDLQHCFDNDPTMQLAGQFQTIFADRIVQYHLSGYEPEFLHYPLYKTRQDEIMAALRYPNLPVIIESTFDSYDEPTQELDYITNFYRQSIKSAM